MLERQYTHCFEKRKKKPSQTEVAVFPAPTGHMLDLTKPHQTSPNLNKPHQTSPSIQTEAGAGRPPVSAVHHSHWYGHYTGGPGLQVYCECHGPGY